MELEQSANRNSETKGDVVGFTHKPGALNRWFLAAHERTSVTGATKALCNMATTHDLRNMISRITKNLILRECNVMKTMCKNW